MISVSVFYIISIVPFVAPSPHCLSILRGLSRARRPFPHSPLPLPLPLPPLQPAMSEPAPGDDVDALAAWLGDQPHQPQSGGPGDAPRPSRAVAEAETEAEAQQPQEQHPPQDQPQQSERSGGGAAVRLPHICTGERKGRGSDKDERVDVAHNRATRPFSLSLPPALSALRLSVGAACSRMLGMSPLTSIHWVYVCMCVCVCVCVACCRRAPLVLCLCCFVDTPPRPLFRFSRAAFGPHTHARTHTHTHTPMLMEMKACPCAECSARPSALSCASQCHTDTA